MPLSGTVVRVLELITADRVLVGPPGEEIAAGAVLFDGERIAAVGPRAALRQRSPGAIVREFPGHTVLPGLINAHVHLAFDATTDFRDNVRGASDEQLLDGMAERAAQLAASGVTTCRDLGDRGGAAARLRREIGSGARAGPRVLAATSPITIHDGHCWFLGGAVDGGESSLREQVRHNARLGADLIKVMVSGGQITPESPPMWASQFDTAQLAIIADEAAAHGLPVAAHAHGVDAIRSAVEVGVHTIEHCTWMTPDRGSDLRPDVVAEMVRADISVCTAMSAAWRTFGDRVGHERAEANFARTRRMDELGLRLLFGTDAGLTGSTFDDPVGALELYEYLGFDAERVLHLATGRTAEGLGIADRTGSLLPGKSADLLVVPDDPRADLQVLRRPALVLCAGRPVAGE
ncbi:amidohydrolase family protein [Saccharopolyspora sp. HNM0983]|uniref:Amidohydrolase family protein n=1 Tax=Saccharopolyspora montiporae TaxID=2781240 RepID=A0A929B7G0_9PSEU|nr:amidohydrolase family protein [Saccharopolyspora sp. HNM0983]MBE9374599.1 amidohydrolase family protein [Saccharopolyspora sp. HNM0983]